MKHSFVSRRLSNRARSSRLAAAMLGASLTTLAFGPSASADVPVPVPDPLGSVVEFQVDSADLLSLVTAHVRATPICVLDSFEVVGTQFVMDHVTINDGASLRFAEEATSVIINESLKTTTNALEIVQPLSFFVRPQEDAEDPTQIGNPPLEIGYNAVLQVGIRDNELCTQLVSMLDDGGNPMDASLFTKVQSMLGDANESEPGTRCSPIGLGAISAMFGDGYAVTGQGVTANADRSRVAFRFELNGDGDSSQSAWDAFYGANVLAPAPASTHFSLFLGADALQGSLQKRIMDGLAGASSIHVNSGTEYTKWKPTDREVEVGTHVGVDTSLCINSPLGADIAVQMPLDLSANGDAITSHVSLSIDPDDDAIAFCATFWSTLVNFAAPVGGPVTLINGPLLAAFTASYIIINANNQNVPQGQAIPNCTQGNNNDFDCSFPLDLPILSLSQYGSLSMPHDVLHATTIQGVTNGLLIGGDVTLVNAPVLVAPEVTVEAPSFGMHGRCGSMSTGYEGGISVTGSGAMCRYPEQWDDPLNAYYFKFPDNVPPSPDYSARLPQDYKIAVAPDAAFWANPYPLYVRLWTSDGIKFAKVPAPAEWQGDAFSFVDDIIRALLGCMQPEGSLPGNPGWFDPHWHVDPPYDLVADVTSSVIHVRGGESAVNGLRLVTTLPARLTHGMRLQNQPVLLGAVVTVTGDGFERFDAASVVSTRADFDVSIDTRGVATLTLASSPTVVFDVPSGQLPRGIDSARVSMPLAARSLGFVAR